MIKREEDILFLVKKLNKELVTDFDRRLNEYGLTSQQGRTLFFINRKVNYEHSEVNQKDLEQRFELSKSTVSGLVKRMEKNGLITIIRNRNKCSLIPTEKSEQIIANMQKSRSHIIEKLFQGFSQEDKERIIKNTQKLIENIRREEDELC